MKLESSDNMSLKENIESFIPYNIQEENDKKLILEYIDMFPDILTRDNKLCHFTASNWIVNKDRTKVLMAYHNIYNSWAWTGGHADGDEDLLRVSIKEASEETGINNLKLLSDGIFSIEILPVSAHIKRGHFVSSHLHLNCTYLFEANEEDEIRIKEDENSGVSWIDIDKAIEVSQEDHMKVIYQKINDKLRIINNKGSEQ